MTQVLIVALAASFLMTGFEEFVRPIGRARGFVALALSCGTLFLPQQSVPETVVSIMASAFVVLIILSFMDKFFGVISETFARRLPRRVPPL